MTRDAEQGFRFVAGMIAILCAIFGLAALLGVPAAGTIFFGMAGMLTGMLLGIGSTRALLPRSKHEHEPFCGNPAGEQPAAGGVGAHAVGELDEVGRVLGRALCRCR